MQWVFLANLPSKGPYNVGSSMKKSKQLSTLGEFGYLRKLLPKLYWPPSLYPQLMIPAGDDAGVVRITPHKVLVATADALVEGRHFERAWFPWEDLGYKALAVNLSDLAAMGAVKPLAALTCAGFPGQTAVESVDKFYRGLKSCAQRWKIGLLGGDTVGSKEGWFLSLTVLGEADPRHLVRRSGARVGDVVMTSGPLGLAGAGLEVLQQGQREQAWTAPLVKAFSRPQPRLELGAWLANEKIATSLLDCSDGLEASVKLISEASGVGIGLDLASVPAVPALKRWAAGQKKPVWKYQLSGGEDYELIFTCTLKNVARVTKRWKSAAMIGRVLPVKEGRFAVTPDGRQLPLEKYGFSHF